MWVFGLLWIFIQFLRYCSSKTLLRPAKTNLDQELLLFSESNHYNSNRRKCSCFLWSVRLNKFYHSSYSYILHTDIHWQLNHPSLLSMYHYHVYHEDIGNQHFFYILQCFSPICIFWDVYPSILSFHIYSSSNILCKCPQDERICTFYCIYNSIFCNITHSTGSWFCIFKS